MKNTLNYYTLFVFFLAFSAMQTVNAQCTIDNLTVLCEGSSEILNVPAITSGATWTVTSSGAPATPRASFDANDPNVLTSTATNPTIYFHSSGFINVSVASSGCSTDRNNLFIGAEAFIDVSVGMEELTLCENQTISLTGITSGNNNGTETYLWSQIGGDATVSFTTPTAKNTNLTSVDAGTSGTGIAIVQFAYTDGNGCVGVFERTYTIYREVSAAVGNGVAADVCLNSNLQLNGVPTGGDGNFTHNWTLLDPPTDITLILDDPNAEDPVLTPAAGAQDGDQYVLTYTAITSEGDCNNATSETITVTVRQNPDEATITHDGNNISCQIGSPVLLQVDIRDELGFLVSGLFDIELSDGTMVTGYENGDNITVMPTATTTYTLVSVSNLTNCIPTSLVGSETITIDETNPTFSNCNTITVDTDMGVCDAFVNVPAPTVNDVCEIVSLTNDRTNMTNANDTYVKGDAVVTWTAMDLAGNVGTCQQTIRVRDQENPTFDCTNQTIGTDMDLCGALFTDGSSTFADNCMVMVVRYRFGNNGAFTEGMPVDESLDLGDTNLTYQIEDADGNESTCTLTVTVEDDDVPTFVDAPNSVTTPTTSGCAGEIPDLTNIMINENCPDNLNVSQDPAQGTAFGTSHGETMDVIVTATDGTNTTTHTVTVTLQDDDAPNITTDCATLNQTAAANPISCNGNVTVGMPLATDNCMVVSLLNDYNGTSDASGPYPTGQTTVTWTAIDPGGNTTTCETIITVADNIVPNLTCPDRTVGTDEGVCTTAYFDDTSILADNCAVASVTYEYVTIFPLTQTGNGKLNGNETFPEGDTEITYTVADNSGNEASCTFTLTVMDDDAPVLDGDTSDKTVNSTSGCEALIPDYTGDFSGTDNCGGSVTITQSPMVGTTFIGSSVVTITGEDSEGNMSSVTFNVTSNSANITCPANVSQAVGAGLCSDLVTVDPLVVSDNCGTATVVNDFNNTDNASGTYAVGVTTVTWTVTFPSGTAQCSNTVTLTDEEDPTLTCADFTISTDADACEAVFTDMMTIISDNCAINDEDIRYTYPNVLPGPIFNESGTGRIENVTLSEGSTTNFSYTVSDVNGNEVSCSFNVTVTDQVAPVIEGSVEDRMIEAMPSNCTGMVPDLTADFMISDNCDNNVTVEQTPAADTEFTTSTVVTITATDNDDNTSQVMINLFIDDNVNPNISCPDNIIQDTDMDACTALVTVPDPMPSDNCSVAMFSNDFNSSEDASGTYDMGTTTVEWSVTDDSGNQNDCSFTVTVNDNQNPVPTCTDFSVLLDENGMASLQVSDVFAGASDNCTAVATLEATVTVSKTTFDEDDAGNQNIISTVTDESGNKGTCVSQVTVNAPLVIELYSFKATNLKEKSALLEWTTANETDNAGFNIQKSIDGIAWTTLDFVEGAGNSNEQVSYEYMDKKPVQGRNYYRLEQVDFNGKATISPVQVLEFVLENNVVVYPNPTSDQIQIQLEAPAEKMVIRLFNNVGQQVILQQTNDTALFTLPLSNLPTGVYFLRVEMEGRSFVEKIIYQ